MHPHSQVVILDELSISDDDLVKMKAGQTSEMEETLRWLAAKTSMTLVALSSSSLLDSPTVDAHLVTESTSETELDQMIARTGFEGVSLKHIMRSSKNIAVATSPDSLDQTRSNIGKIQKSISPGSSSTVPGARPKAMVYKHTDDVDYSKLAGFVTQHLRTVDTERIKCAVLTDGRICPRKLSEELIQRGITPSCYEGGVDAGDGGEVELSAWLKAEAGVLVTSELQFRGCEADTVIYVKTDWGESSESESSRSPLTRAVAGLTMVTGDLRLWVPGLRRLWDVEIVEEGAGKSKSNLFGPGLDRLGFVARTQPLK